MFVCIALLLAMTLVVSCENKTPVVEKFTVTFDTDGGGQVEAQSVEKGNTAVEPKDPVKNGYVFKGWTLNNESYNFNTPVTANITLKAKWTPSLINQVTVTFDSNGGTKVDTLAIEKGSIINAPEDPTRTGATFKGWTLNNQTFTFEEPITSDITLVASWEWTGIKVSNESELREAVLTEGANILLEKDLVLSDYIPLTKPVTIDGNGKKVVVMFPGHDYDNSGLLINSAGVTLRNLVLESGETAKAQMALIYIHSVNGTEDAPIIIENNTLICEQNTIGIQTTHNAGSYLIIKDNEIYDSKYGMYFNQISNSIIENNIIERTKYNGIIIAGGNETYISDNVVIQNNELSNIATANFSNKTYATGIYVDSFTNDVTVDDTNNVDMYISSNPSIHFENDGVLVVNENELKSAIEAGKSVVLCENVTLSETVNINNGQDIVINLNGNDITTSKYFKISANGEDINGGNVKVTGSGTIDGQNGFTFLIYGNGNNSETKECKLTIDKDVIVKGTYAISLYDTNNKSYDVSIDIYGQLEGYQPIYINGNINNTDRCPILKINDGAKIICNENSGIYIAGYSNTIIGDAEITSKGNAINIAAGKLEINGADITGGDGYGTDAGSGGSISTVKSSAVFVKQHTTNLPVEVTINSGTLSAYIPFYQHKGELEDNANPEDVRIVIDGGNFISNNKEGSISIKSDDKTGFITGGSFSTDPFEYLAVGSFAERNSDGTFTVTQKDYVEITEENKAEHYDEYRNLGTIAYASNIMAMLNEAAGYYEGVGFKSTEDGGVYYSFENARITLSRNALETKLNVEFPEEDYPDSFQVTLNGTVYVHTEENVALDEMIFDFTDGYTINEVRHTGYFRMKQTTSNPPKSIVLLDDKLLYGIEVFIPSNNPSNP